MVTGTVQVSHGTLLSQGWCGTSTLILLLKCELSDSLWFDHGVEQRCKVFTPAPVSTQSNDSRDLIGPLSMVGPLSMSPYE